MVQRAKFDVIYTQAAALQIKQPIINLLSCPSVGWIYDILTFKTNVMLRLAACVVLVESDLKEARVNILSLLPVFASESVFLCWFWLM